MICLTATEIAAFTLKNNDMRRLLLTLILLLSAAVFSSAQTGTWSGKLDLQSTKLALVFHLDGDNPTMDSPDQGAKGIPIEVARTATGSITINNYAQRAAVAAETKVSEWINDVIRFVGELIFQMSYYGMLVAQRIFMTILATFAPIMFALSIVPPWSNAWAQWMGKYLSLSLWGFVVYFCLYYIDFILMYNLMEDIKAYDTPVEEYRITSRGGLGIRNYMVTEKTGPIVGIKVVDGQEDLLLMTQAGILIRTAVDSIRIAGRATQGVIVMRFKEEGDHVISMALADREAEKEAAPAEE